MNTTVFDNLQLPESLPMKTGKAKSWLGEYHWVSLPRDPDKIYPFDDAVKWCNEYLGKTGSRWFEKNLKFYFKEEKDMALFILKFCS
jgi:hypothetical protein